MIDKDKFSACSTQVPSTETSVWTCCPREGSFISNATFSSTIAETVTAASLWLSHISSNQFNKSLNFLRKFGTQTIPARNFPILSGQSFAFQRGSSVGTRWQGVGDTRFTFQRRARLLIKTSPTTHQPCLYTTSGSGCGERFTHSRTTR